MDDEFFEIEDIPRSADEIARRALILSSVISCAYGDSKDDNIMWLKQEGLWKHVSPEEAAFLKGESDSQKDIHFTWRIEALVPLLWAIGKIPSLPYLTTECDTKALASVMVWPFASTREFIESSALQPEHEISEEYEKVYDAHWAVRDASLNNKPIPDNLNPGAVYERHYAFNWLRGYMGQEWDEISTDT